jgi:hypothetical protein
MSQSPVHRVLARIQGIRLSQMVLPVPVIPLLQPVFPVPVVPPLQPVPVVPPLQPVPVVPPLQPVLPVHIVPAQVEPSAPRQLHSPAQVLAPLRHLRATGMASPALAQPPRPPVCGGRC